MLDHDNTLDRSAETERWLQSLMADGKGSSYCRHERWRLVSFKDGSNGGISARFQCLACGSLVRAVKSPEGEISLDFKGKKPGRGAYVCRKAECLQKAKKAKQVK